MTSSGVDTTLTGYTIAVTDQGLRPVGALLRQQGAAVVEVPTLQIVPGHRDARLRTATRRLIREPVDHVVATSATGWNRWLSAAAMWGLSDALATQLARASILSMNAAVGAALVQSGFAYAWSSVSGELAEAVTWLLDQVPASHRVAVTADEPLPARLIGMLRASDIDVIVVPTRRWAPPAGLGPLHRLAQMVIQREVHAVTFATAIVASALMDATTRTGHRNLLLRALATDVAVVTADPESAALFRERDIPVRLACDDASDELVRLVVEALVARRREFLARGHLFVVQGDALLVDGVTIRLAPRPATLMRSLADYPGRDLSRATLEQLAPVSRRATPGGIEHAVRRLRTQLGEYGWLVATIYGRGYRLVVD